MTTEPSNPENSSVNNSQENINNDVETTSTSETTSTVTKTRRGKRAKKKSGFKKAFRIFMGILTTVLAIAGIIFATNLILQRVVGYDIIMPTSGSMEPTIKVGDAAYAENIEPEDIQVDDIIMVENPQVETRVTHRVIEVLDVNEVNTEDLRLGAAPLEINEDTVLFRMQGDANEVPDPRDYVINSSEEVSKVVDYPALLDGPFVIPNGGHMIQLYEEDWFYYTLASLVAIVVVWSFWPKSEESTTVTEKEKRKA